MRSRTTIPAIIRQKLSAFTGLEGEFVASFQFVEALHGQKLFDALTISDAVRYLHACFICDCKDRLLSVMRTIPRYHGEEALRLLEQWQNGDTASVIAFLHERLDSQPFADITRQWQAARQAPGDAALADRLAHGRIVLLNRAMNQLRLFAAIFARDQDEVLSEVRQACTEYGHDPEGIARELAAWQTKLYAYIPHQQLAERNMQVMNKLGLATLLAPSDLPGDRTWRVSRSDEAHPPFADTLIPAYVELTAPLHNNLQHVAFVDRPDTSLDIARSREVVVEALPPPEA